MLLLHGSYARISSRSLTLASREACPDRAGAPSKAVRVLSHGECDERSPQANTRSRRQALRRSRDADDRLLALRKFLEFFVWEPSTNGRCAKTSGTWTNGPSSAISHE